MIDPATLFAELTIAFNQHAWAKAQALAVRLLPMAPRHPALHYMAGVAAMELQQMPKALAHLHQAADLDSGRVEFVTQFAKALTLGQMPREARLAADRAMALSPTDPATFDTLGVIYTQTHAHAEAAAAFRGAVALNPTHAPYHFNLATALLATGEIESARSTLETCIDIDPCYWKAHLTLAQQRRQSAEDNHIERLHSILKGRDADLKAQTYLHMALAKEYEDCGDYPTAFTHYTRGKSAAGAGRNYDIAQDEALFAAITAAFPAPQASPGGCPSDEPIFVIGMPRSGTTLVERIISSHPDVHSAGELLNFGLTLKRHSGSRTSPILDLDTVHRLQGPDWKKVGEDYLASTRPGTAHKPRFIDKLPHNFLNVGWIARALPNARIICLRRDPMDTCLSNFRQLFAAQSPQYGYSFDLLDTGRYYTLFDRLIAHWQRVLPGRILEMHYEALVDSQEASTRQLLEFCRLPWHDDCLRFEDNKAPVNTASVVQVRKPVYRTSLQRWKKYGAQLNELQELLNAAGIAIPS
ncbi:tetratricopeptide repeat-containing sulfotransferase family protein [Rhodanobacter ginsengisoli]|uniref:Tetratricopeptide repeat-containing sulfotransferase family protein n=1 Tax=Rhodanobacter ginsengisoli TaxID=418646 RepID=A0ABW0QHI8_9GAMM